MSRIGNKPITITEGVTITAEGNVVRVKGPKGELALTLHPLAAAVISDGKVIVSRKDESKLAKSVHGLTRSLLFNMVEGVVSGYEKRLELVGTGYRATKKGSGLSMTLGFSHPIDFPAPAGVTIDVEGNTVIIVRGIDKHDVGQAAANIRALRPPEPYKGKGVRYAGEHVRRKVGKQAKTAGTAA